MFDARSLFEDLMRGGQQSQQAPGMGELGDLLRQLTQPGQQDTGADRGRGDRSSGIGETNALDDLMRQFNQDRDAPSAGGSAGRSEQGGGFGLDDLLRQLTEGQGRGQGGGVSQPSAPGAGSGPGAGGGLGDILGQVFGQRPEGQGGADPRGGSAQDGLRDIIEKMGGRGGNADDIVRQITDFLGNNKLGAGAALGGLGALILGTRTGRSIAVNAAKLGALAVVGGLAYKAYQNYRNGQSPEASRNIVPEAAPGGTGFEADSVSNEAARTYIRGMIAAAASDGRLDGEEQQRILGSLQQQGLDREAEEFLAHELNNPATIDDLVRGVRDEAEALQLYTAARVAIEPDTRGEQQFLYVLAERLGISHELRAHIDEGARGMT
jgi:uncharacterized membrane protein YebE (DUF533 family)